MRHTKRLGIATGTIFVGLTSILIASQLLTPTSQVSAADTRYFRADNVISDPIFTDHDSMSVNQIQQFLQSKNSVCLKNFTTLSLNDTNHDGLGDEPYGKGANEKVSAARLIWQAAQLYRISPKVILVTLQKEQGLITRTDCPSWRYNTALGYGCPDSAPCDNSAYGFTRQIDYGVWHFRGFFDDSYPVPPTVPGSKFIAYNPSSNCGGKTITIKNRATAALYSYTPYQPNAATLAAAQGQTVPCGAYGNLNFWRYFTDWFGSPQVPTVFKTTTSDQAYLLSGDSYFRIPSPSMLYAYGFNKNDIGVVTPSVLGTLQNGGSLKYTARFGDNAIYLIDQGRRLQFPDPATYNTFGYSIGEEVDLDPALLSQIPKGSNMSVISRVSGNDAIYLVENSKKRHISSPGAYTQLGSPTYSSRPTVTLSPAYVASIANGGPILSPNTFARDTSNNSYYFWDGSGLQKINNPTISELRLQAGYSSSSVEQLPINRPAISKFVKNSSGQHFILDGRQKILLASGDLAKVGRTTDAFTSTSDSFLQKAGSTTKNFVPIFRIDGKDAIYLVSNGNRAHLTSPQAVSDQDLTISQAINITSQTATLFPDTGKKIIAVNGLFRIGLSDAIYAVNSTSSSLHVPSMDVMRAYGYRLKDVLSLTSAGVSSYPNTGTLDFFSKDSSNKIWHIDDSGIRRLVPNTISDSSAYNLNLANLKVLSGDVLAHYAQQTDLTNLIRARNTDAVYKIEDGAKRWITSSSALLSQGLSFENVRTVSVGFKDSLPTGASIQ